MSEIKRILQQITAICDVPDPAILKRLIDELRVTDKEPALANEKIQELIRFYVGIQSMEMALLVLY